MGLSSQESVKHGHLVLTIHWMDDETGSEMLSDLARVTQEQISNKNQIRM